MPEDNEQNVDRPSADEAGFSAPANTGPEAQLPPPAPPKPKTAKILIGAVLAVALVVGLYFVNSRWIAPATQIQVAAAGNYPPAPAFSLTDITGGKLDLADYKGKVVVLDFWATWCGPCRIEIPEFIKMQDRYRDQGFSVIGLAVQDTPDSVQEFYKQFHMNYPVAMGSDDIAAQYGGILGLPTTFVIGRDGRVYSKHSGATSAAVFDKEVRELLGAKGGSEASGFQPAGRPEDVEVSTPEQVKAESNREVPGVDITRLSAADLTEFKKQLEQEQCDCGCNLNVLRCRREDSSCGTSRRLAKEALKKFQESKKLQGTQT